MVPMPLWNSIGILPDRVKPSSWLTAGLHTTSKWRSWLLDWINLLLLHISSMTWSKIWTRFWIMIENLILTCWRQLLEVHMKIFLSWLVSFTHFYDISLISLYTSKNCLMFSVKIVFHPLFFTFSFSRKITLLFSNSQFWYWV